MRAETGRGWFGSIRKRVAAEVGEHMALNLTVRRLRHSSWQRALRAVIGHSFWTFLFIYLSLDIAIQMTSIALTIWWPGAPPLWITPSTTKDLLKDAAGFLITAQVGMLGVISVAVGLVTLIAQRNDGASANADIRIYYAESLAYGVVSSSVALLVVMVVQVFWPFQFMSHLAGFDRQHDFIKVALTAVHVAWLSVNLAAFAQFIVVSLHFVEPEARERLRERYTANTVLRQDLTRSLLVHFIFEAQKSLHPVPHDDDKLNFTMAGLGMPDDWDEELVIHSKRPFFLSDIWLRPLSVAIRSWWRRSAKIEGKHG